MLARCVCKGLLPALLAVSMLACKSERDPRSGGARDAGVAHAKVARHDAALEPAFARFPSLADAVAHIVGQTRPRVIGFGEFHQTNDATPVRPTLDRFNDQLDALVRGASDLIVETWVEAGKCGAGEQAVNNDVREVTERPPVVENQLLSLLTGAKERGLGLHLMTMECADYARVLQDEEVDYAKLLQLIKEKLAGLAARVWQYRAANPPADGTPRTILIYGGALHNDIHPRAGIEDISYAAEVRALVGDGGYIEVDLFVPEYIEGNPLIVQEPWYPSFSRHADRDHVLVFERAPRSYVVILRKGLIQARPSP